MIYCIVKIIIVIASFSASTSSMKISFQVFGLGNKTYENFNAMGKYFDKRMADLGATRIHEMGTGDDDSNIEDHFITWKEDMWKSVCKHFGISGDKIDVKLVMKSDCMVF